MSMLKYWIWFSLHQKVSTVEKIHLLKAFGTPEHIFRANTDEILSCCKVNRLGLRCLADKSLDAAETVIERCMELDIQMITMQDSQYPARLAEIYDPPVVMYVKGRLPQIDDYPAIAIVGTRKCTSYALSVSETIGREVAEGGGIVISGLAEGVDQAALRGALKSGNPTIGVLGCGLDIEYPKSAGNMRRDIEQKGAVISEYAPGTPALPHNFPIRNRIISGLSVGVAVIESPERSGALITAYSALEQNRDVFAHPGTVEDDTNAGNYALMRDGAKPVRTGADILAEYVDLFPKRVRLEKTCTKRPAFLAKKKQDVPEQILQVLGDEPMHIDEIITACRLSAAEVLSNLTVMEITGAVRQLPGKFFQREPGW